MSLAISDCQLPILECDGLPSLYYFWHLEIAGVPL